MSPHRVLSPGKSLRRQRGVSLVELMVAMVVGSLVILAAGSLFQEVNANAREVLRLADRQAVLSYALDTITAAVRRGDVEHDGYQCRHDEAHGQHLGDEHQRDLLNLRGRLHDGDDHTDEEAHEEHGSRDVQHRRDRQLEEVADLLWVHRLPHEACGQ